MYRKYLKYLFSMVSAIYFILAGTGYNIVQFCCDDCSNEGIDFVLNHSCATIHHEQAHDCFDFNYDKPHVDNQVEQIQTCSNENSCQVTRVQIDEFSIANRVINANTSFIHLFVAITTQFTFSNHLKYIDEYNAYSPPPHFFVLKGREILSNKSVLVI